MKRKYIKILSSILAVTMLCTSTAVVAYTAGNNSAEKNKAQVSATAAATGEKLYKDETVYVLANADGSVKKVIVSDWIKNNSGAATITDKSDLENVKNLKGEESYTLNEDNMRVWDAQGKDIYYQGESTKNLPVNLAVSYKLDGKSISAEELAGKSGRVTMRFDYTNNEYKTVSIDGKQETIYVPFVMLTGMMLDNDTFTNVEVSNGKLINDGDKSVVIGLALPGLQQNLNISKEKLELPDYVEITADVENFELTTTLTVATNDVFGQLDMDSVGSIDDLKNAMSSLTGAMDQLLDGSSQLYTGVSTLLDKSGELISGINQLAEGSKKLASGAASLEGGAGELQQGISTLASGLSTLSSNNTALNDGAKQVFDSLLSMADTQIAAAGLKVDKLTVDNYSKVLSGIVASLDENTVYKMAYNTALSKVTEGVNAQKPVIKEQVTAAVRSKVLEGALAAVEQNMTAEEYEKAVSAGLITAEVQQHISAAVDANMKSTEIQNQISAATEAKVQEIISQKMKSDEITSQISAAVESAKNGASSITALKAQLDSYNQFYQGLIAYTSGVADASTGADKLNSGAGSLKAGATELANGANSLSQGISTLQDGSGALVDGVQQLKDGAMQLSDGLKQFNEEGIQKLVDAVDGDLNGLITRLKATEDVSKDYQSFSGVSDDMDGTVKFIYKTDAIKEDK